MVKKHCNIPIFIPQRACPHQCIYCNQRYISGQAKSLSLLEVKQTIDTYLSSIKDTTCTQVAFFGGTFTAIPLQEQIDYLEVVKPYIQKGLVDSIRLSTRPDYINPNILTILKSYGVKDIELGAQSLDDEVLAFCQRGHSCEDIIKASKLIHSFGFNLGLQMMIGLPKDTLQKSIATAQKIVSLKAQSTRIYPTLVIDKTPLADMYRQGLYQPLTLEQAVLWSKQVYKIFIQNDVQVLRVGLHPSRDLINKKGFIAGPFHVSFFELVLSSLFYDKLSVIEPNTNTIIVNPKDINYVIGYNSQNLKALKKKSPHIKIVQSNEVTQGTFNVA